MYHNNTSATLRLPSRLPLENKERSSVSGAFNQTSHSRRGSFASSSSSSGISSAQTSDVLRPVANCAKFKTKDGAKGRVVKLKKILWDNRGTVADFCGILSTRQWIISDMDYGDKFAPQLLRNNNNNNSSSRINNNQYNLNAVNRQESGDHHHHQNNNNMMMNGVSDAHDAHDVAMETMDSAAVAKSAGGISPQSGAVAANVADKNKLNEQQRMLEKLNGMSLSERRLAMSGAHHGDGAPCITLTSVDEGEDGADVGFDRSRRMTVDSNSDYEMESDGQISPRFLTVPKLQEVGKERRPPTMVKTI